VVVKKCPQNSNIYEYTVTVDEEHMIAAFNSLKRAFDDMTAALVLPHVTLQSLYMQNK